MIEKAKMDNIITSAQKGDKHCLEKVIKMYKPYIIKTARSIYINGYEIDDLIQIGSIALVNAIHKYDISRKGNFTIYATIAIKNSLNLELRKVIAKKYDEKFKCSLNSLNKDGIEFMEMISSEENLEEDIILKEKVAILKKALEKLPEEEREVIKWYYLEDKPLKEFAERKGLAINTAVKRKGRAIKKLKEYFLKLYN